MTISYLWQLEKLSSEATLGMLQKRRCGKPKDLCEPDGSAEDFCPAAHTWYPLPPAHPSGLSTAFSPIPLSSIVSEISRSATFSSALIAVQPECCLPDRLRRGYRSVVARLQAAARSEHRKLDEIVLREGWLSSCVATPRDKGRS
jgi:hypothetical protein